MEEALIRFVKTELLGDEGVELAVSDEIFVDGTVDFLGVTSLVDFIEKEFRVSIATDDVTPENFCSIAAVTSFIRALQTEAAGLTNAQEMLWTNQQLHSQVPLYNTAFLFTIDGPVDAAAFVAAFGRLVEDAEILRTVVASEDGVPRQAVLSRFAFRLPIVDISDAPDPDGAARAWAQDRCQIPLDVGQSTFDAALLRLADDRFAWYFNQHHIVSDAWALGILYERLEALYRAIREDRSSELRDLPSFATYVEYERAERESSLITDKITDAGKNPASPAMYGTRPTGGSTENERVSVDISVERSRALQELANSPGVRAFTPDLSMFQLLATATFAYAHRVSGQTRIAIGTPVHNRSSAEFRRMPGLFMEVYPLDVGVEDDATFSSLHSQVASATAELIRSAKPGHARAGANRHINAILNYLTVKFAPFDGMPVLPEWIHTGNVDPQHVLRLQVHDFADSGRLTFSFDCSTEAFDAATRASIPDHFAAILDAMIDDWDQPIATVDLLTRPQRVAVDQTINADRRPADVHPNVIAQFLGRAAQAPDAVAIIDQDRSLTYDEVERLSGSIASGLASGSLVGIALNRSAEAVVSMIGVLRAGAVYVPIDPAWPQDRISFVVDDAQIDMVIAAQDLGLDVQTVRFDDATAYTPQSAVSIADDDLAYVLYTSGSTGTPKGVMIEHSALANYVSWASRFYDRGQRLTFPLFTALTFDLTVTSVFVPLVSGGTIRVYPETPGQSDLSILEVLEEDVVDIVKLTPSHLALMAEAPARSSRIRQLILGGEDLTTAVAGRAAEHFRGRVTIHNEYGPTEATVGCVVHTYDPATDTDPSVPIGKPIDGARAHVVDAAGQPVPIGVPGELWIAGAGLARGYVGRPDLTAERFVPGDALDEGRAYRTGDMARVRPTGTIEYLGRRDDQVKIKGIRVELGEIESALASHPRVTATAVRLWEQGSEDSPDGLIYCSRCGLASDYPAISFDAARVCNECRAFDDYNDRARVYFKPERELTTLLTSQRGQRGTYDCISLLSGGKDSSYVLCRLVDMGLRVLAVTLENGYLSDQAKGNIARTVEALRVDHQYVSTPAMNEIFVDSLQRHANVCNGCFKTIYTLSLQKAAEEDIPYIVTGLSRGQFFETRLTAELFTELTVSSDQIDSNVLEARKAYHQVDDAVHRLLDVSMFDDDSIFEAVQFVDFYRFVDVGLDELYSYLEQRVPWVKPTDTGRSTNCLINDVGIYYHRKVRGYHNYALPYSWDVRMGHKTREAALEELDDDIDVTEVARMLEEIGFPDDVTGSESGRTLVSYYVAPVEIPVPQLREHMAAALPQQLVPSKFVRLDAIPLTQNGKVDRDELPSPDHQRPQMDTVFVAAQSDNEIVLTRVWEQVLGISGIGVRDNYFDLGGDSIAAVQIIARAHRYGLPITMNQLADELTIENLAAVAGSGETQRAERIVGPVELTPIQRWFFDEVDTPGHFHHVVRVAVPEGIDSRALRDAFDALGDHHDALRQSFRRNDDVWESSVADAVSSIPLQEVELAQAESLTDFSAGSPLLAPFDVASAPLMRGALIVSPGGETELVLVAHHLIVDTVSWSHLLDDLGHLSHAVDKASVGYLPAVTTSVRDWTDRLVDSAQELDAEPWQRIAAAEAAAWPTPEFSEGEQTGRQRIDTDMTARLLAHTSEAGLGVDELLVAALASALSSSLHADRVRVFLEGHGRESDSASMDVTRTMGWFTSLYPVVVEVPASSDLTVVAGALLDDLRSVSQSGRDYGVLRYLHPDEGLRSSIALDHRGHVVFNYLGRVTHAGAEESELVLAGPIELDRPRGSNRIFGAEVTAYIDGDALTIEWSTDGATSERLEAVVSHIVDQLRAFIEDGADAPDSFALAGLDEHGMSKLASMLESTDRGTR